MDHDEQLDTLAKIAKEINENNIDFMVKLKSEHEHISRPDFIWHFLLQSFATMGNSHGWNGLIGNKENYNQVRFDELEKLTHEQRVLVVEDVCQKAKIRMPSKKADFILKCFERVTELGGLETAKQALLELKGRESKIQFLKLFHGIGPKYSRNIMMDVYHEDFRDSIAIDARIKGITEKLGLTFHCYEDHEDFLLDVANRAGLNGWELDRLMYNFTDEFKHKITGGYYGNQRFYHQQSSTFKRCKI